MFSFLRSKKKQASAEIAAAAEAHAKRMDLEERKAFRQEMLYQSIRESFLAMEVIGSMYKFWRIGDLESPLLGIGRLGWRRLYETLFQVCPKSELLK